jgi:hypothetical protein
MVPAHRCLTRVMPDTSFPAGPVTRLGPRVPASIDPPGPPAPPGFPGPEERPPNPRRRLWWFAGVAGVVLLAGLVAVLVGSPGDGRGLFDSRPGPRAEALPPLARACPAPTAPAANPPPTAPALDPSTARTVDTEAGISYNAYGPPWQPWNTVWRAGTLEVPYKVGQHFVTESGYDGFSDYHASILSAAVPAANNDSYAFDLECVGRQVAADVRAEYYPQPNRLESIRDEKTVLGGLPAWVTVFRLHFQRAGLKATDELVGLAILDVGKPTAAILYVSIPGTHRQFDYVVDDTLTSVRPT